VCCCEIIPSPLRRRLGNSVVSRVSDGGIGMGVADERRGGTVPVKDIVMPLPCSVTLVG
jgi:hypothetical protein